jgi:hypothetical protein
MFLIFLGIKLEYTCYITIFLIFRLINPVNQTSHRSLSVWLIAYGQTNHICLYQINVSWLHIAAEQSDQSRPI